MTLALLVALAPPADAHGIWGHVHVTGWAVENMPDDELRRFLLEPEVFNALLFGAVFTDTGYAIPDANARAYSEHTHWEPFIEDYIQWMLENDPPPWDSLEPKKRVAFLLGSASHGMQDSIFDSIFLHQVELRDGAGQENTDPGTDGFLVLDDHIRFIPHEDIPIETVLELYEGLDAEITQQVIDEAVGVTTDVYINDDVGLTIAAQLGEQHAPHMPWGREHYMDPAVPGSLRAEIYPTMRYQQAIWKRLHGQLDADDVTVFAFPEEPRRLRDGDHETVDSWITLIFGAGVTYEGDLTELLDDSGQPVAFTQANTRWGAGHTRLIRLLPDEPLTPGGWYTARLKPGAQLVDGRTTTAPYELTFQVACLDDDDPSCPDLGDIPVAHIDGIPDEVDEPQGCGCSSGAGPVAAAALLATLFVRRRP